MAVKKTATRAREFSDIVIDAIREPLIVLDQDLKDCRVHCRELLRNFTERSPSFLKRG
jgi:hypothetical protein